MREEGERKRGKKERKTRKELRARNKGERRWGERKKYWKVPSSESTLFSSLLTVTSAKYQLGLWMPYA